MKNKTTKYIAAIFSDIIIIAALNAVIYGIFVFTAVNPLLIWLVAAITAILYFTVFLLLPISATPGMLMFGLKKSAPKKELFPCVFKKGSGGKTKCYLIPEDGLVFGRDPYMCGVLFAPREPAVSRCHCSIKYNQQTEAFLLEDLGSSYGTFTIDGKKIKPSSFAALKNGDKFYVGADKNEFYVGFQKELQ